MTSQQQRTARAMRADWPTNPADQDWYGTIAREFTGRFVDGAWQWQDPETLTWHPMADMIRICRADETPSPASPR